MNMINMSQNTPFNTKPDGQACFLPFYQITTSDCRLVVTSQPDALKQLTDKTNQ